MKIFVVRFVSFLLFFMTLWLEAGWNVLQYNCLPAETESVTSVTALGPRHEVELCKPIDMFCVLSRKNTEKKVSEKVSLSQIDQSIVQQPDRNRDAGLLSLTQFEHENTALLAERYGRGYYLYSQGRLVV